MTNILDTHSGLANALYHIWSNYELNIWPGGWKFLRIHGTILVLLSEVHALCIIRLKWVQTFVILLHFGYTSQGTHLLITL